MRGAIDYDYDYEHEQEQKENEVRNILRRNF